MVCKTRTVAQVMPILNDVVAEGFRFKRPTSQLQYEGMLDV